MRTMVAIVGRPNVGKSTLFNRLIKRREAIVDAISGVTRDRHYGQSDWNGKFFSVIDTGGYIANSEDVFQKEIHKQVDLALGEADLIVFVVDATEGVTPLDEDIIKLLRKTKKPVFTVANKTDSFSMMAQVNEFYSMGISQVYPISSINGSGTGELLDDLVARILPQREETINETPRVAVVGRPNAGKSSFINTLIGEERYIVTDIAGTTRDSIDTPYNRFGFDFTLVDTAGIRKKSKVKEDLEFYSVMRSVRAIENCDICLIVVDASRGFEKQDNVIFWLAERNRKGVVILVNKWDLIEKDNLLMKRYETVIKEQISPFSNVPIVFISVLEKKRIFKAIEITQKVHENRSRRIPTKKLNNAMLPIIEKTPPPAIKGKYVKVKFCTQLPTPTPQFVFFANLPQYVKEPYKRFVENQLRSLFDFEGVPIQIYFRKK